MPTNIRQIIRFFFLLSVVVHPSKIATLFKAGWGWHMLHLPFIKYLVFGRAGPLKSSRRIRRQKSVSIVMTLYTYPINMLKAGPDTCVCVTDGSSEWPSHCSPPLIVHPPLHPSSFPSPHLSSHPSYYPCYLHLFLLFNSFSFPFNTSA